MRPQKIQRTELLNQLMLVLRTKGYEGASLNDLAESSGLKKASLYHRYPGGKQEIASAVLTHVEDWTNDNIFDLLLDKTISPSERIEKVIENINTVYDCGALGCIIRALSMGNGIKLFGAELKESMDKWINSFTAFGIELGDDENTAKEKAMNVPILIQGSLVVGDAIGDTAPFQKALLQIGAIYSTQ